MSSSSASATPGSSSPPRHSSSSSPSPSHTSRRRTPPLGRALAKRTTTRPAPVFSTSPPPHSATPFPSATERAAATDVFSFKQLSEALEPVGTAKKDVEEKPPTRITVKLRGPWGSQEERSRMVERLEKLGGKRRRVTTIQDLPDELLLKIFGELHDSFGFRPRSMSSWLTSWYAPPFRVELVCRRWLPLCRTLFYRNLAIDRLPRITSLLRTLQDPTIASLVRNISLRIPPTSPPPLSTIPISPPEADAVLAPTTSEQMRALIQACPHVLRLDLSGLDPSTLFTPSPPTSFSPILQLRLSSVTMLSLSSSPSGPRLAIPTLRDVLLSLTGLKSLHIRGFTSIPTQALDLALPSTTRMIRHLPVRLRGLRLERLSIVDSSFSPTDLATLFSHISPSSLKTLIIDEIYTPVVLPGEPDRDPTLVGLLLLPDRTILSSLRDLRLSLFNYPILLPTPSLPIPAESLAIDDLVSSLPHLELLGLGGPIATSSILSLLPSTLQRLSIRAVPAITPAVTVGFLTDLARKKMDCGGGGGMGGTRRVLGTSRKDGGWEDTGSLRVLEVRGGETTGWKKAASAWEVQKACWAAGVVWVG